jgi:hypothetical protein
MAGPHDGKKRTYYFGRRSETSYQVETTSLAKAIRSFRVGAMFPHQYSTAPIGEKVLGERGYTKTVYRSSKPGAVVPVHVIIDRNWDHVTDIPIEAPAEDDFGPALIAAQAHLQASPTSTALAPATEKTGLATTDRHELEERQLELERQMGELELQKQKLNEMVRAMQEEVKRRLEQIWMIELYLGSKEEVKRLAEGAPAPSTTPITVVQQVLCMDEELAVWDWTHNPDRIGEFDYQNLDDFDEWLTSDPAHLEAIFPYQKGMIGLRVRRREKERSGQEYAGISGAFRAMAEAEADQMTYLLVRNGENLYRLWIDVKLWPRLFPNQGDYDKMEADRSWDRKDAEDRMKSYMAGLLAIQGILDRSDLLHPLPQPKINVYEDVDCFEFVRNGENHSMLVDGTNPLAHLTWDTYRKWLREQIAEGVRVMWVGRPSYSDDDRLYHRTNIKSVYTWPGWGEIVLLDQWKDEDEARKTWFGHRGSFLYLPDEEVETRDAWGYYERVPRTKRIRFGCYGDEILPVDYMSWRVLEHLIHDRNARPSYGKFFKPAFLWWRDMKAQAAKERPFVDLVLARCGVDLDNEAERARCERLVRWWKMKTKKHRTIDTDDAKALRMIEKAFKKGDDHDNDPEKLLFEVL